MALTIFNGIMAAIDDSTFSQMLTDLGVLPDGHGIATGLAVSPGTGRAVNVGAGRSLQAGTSGVLSATTSVTIAANTSTSPRNDLVCVQCDWAAARAAYLNTTGDVLAKSAAARLAAGSLIAVQGTASSTPADPALTQTPGTLWQEPIKRVRVAAGATSFTTSNLTNVTKATGPVSEKTCSGTVLLSDGGTDPRTVAVTFPVGLFTATPRIVISADDASAKTVTSNLNAIYGTRSTAGFTAAINSTSTASVHCDWIASGT